jgi:hypothetical protein
VVTVALQSASSSVQAGPCPGEIEKGVIRDT